MKHLGPQIKELGQQWRTGDRICQALYIYVDFIKTFDVVYTDVISFTCKTRLILDEKR